MGILRGLLLLMMTAATAQASREDVRFLGPALYPESIAYRAATAQFYVGAVRLGAIYTVDREDRRYATAKLFVDDKDAPSITGLAVDEKRGRLYACVSDGGKGIKTSHLTQNRLAALAVYDLESGNRIAWHELYKLHPGNHGCSALALGPDGTVYATDSAAPVIYKITPSGEATLLCSSEKFREESGEGLSSIAFHEEGYLLAAMHEKGQLWKVPLTKGEEPQAVKLPRPLSGASGLVFIEKDTLVLVQGAGRNVIHRLVSGDDWKTAQIRKTSGRIRHYPTEAVLVGSRIYVLESQLDALFDNKPATGDTKFTIKHLGYLK